MIVLGPGDAGELLTLQRAAYVTEAQDHEDPFLPPLTETLGELRARLADPHTTILGLREGERLIGTVSLRVDGDVAEIGRLAVAPDRQGEGIGTRLMRAIEGRAPAAVRELRLFTGEHSAGNLRLYTRLGYRETRRENVGNHDIVFLAKPR